MAEKVYVLTEGGQYKIGESVDPGRRLREVKEHHPEAVLVSDPVHVNNGSEAEKAAQRAVETQLGMTKVVADDGKPTDWFKVPSGVNADQVQAVVEKAVRNH